MQRLKISCGVRRVYTSLGAEGLILYGNTTQPATFPRQSLDTILHDVVRSMASAPTSKKNPELRLHKQIFHCVMFLSPSAVLDQQTRIITLHLCTSFWANGMNAVGKTNRYTAYEHPEIVKKRAFVETKLVPVHPTKA